MSLPNLLPHLCVIQRSDMDVQSDEGFIDYQGGWITLFENIRCNVQEANLRDAIKSHYSKEEEINEDRIYYIRSDVYNKIQQNPNIRAIVYRENFRKKFDVDLLNKLNDNGNKSLFNIYKMNSNVNITEGRIGTNKRVYILRCEKTTKMDL